MCRSRRELSNEYSLTKFGFDTVENELSKVCRSKQAIPTPGHKSGTAKAKGSALNHRHGFSDRPDRRLREIREARLGLSRRGVGEYFISMLAKLEEAMLDQMTCLKRASIKGGTCVDRRTNTEKANLSDLIEDN